METETTHPQLAHSTLVHLSTNDQLNRSNSIHIDIPNSESRPPAHSTTSSMIGGYISYLTPLWFVGLLIPALQSFTESLFFLIMRLILRVVTSNDGQLPRWLRPALQGIMEGLCSIVVVVIDATVKHHKPNEVIIEVVKGLCKTAISMTSSGLCLGYLECEIELSALDRDKEAQGWTTKEYEQRKKHLPRPVYDATISLIAFLLGAALPLIGSVFLHNGKVRISTVLVAASLLLVVLGCFMGRLGRSTYMPHVVRLLLAGWMAMGINHGSDRLLEMWKSGKD